MNNRSENILTRIAQIQNLLNKFQISSFLIDGGLLGVVRSGEIIAWDWDCEIAFVDQDITIDRFKEVIEGLIDIGLQISSVSIKKYLKINCEDESISNFKFSIIGLKKNKNYFLRPRFKYPEIFFKNSSNFILSNGLSVIVPQKYFSFLDFVYKEWEKPTESGHNRDYLKRGVFRYNYFFDISLRFFQRILRIFDSAAHVLLSDNFFGREALFRLQLRNLVKYNTQFLQIGSSDGAEVREIFKFAKIIDKFIVVEPHTDNVNRIFSLAQNFIQSQDSEKFQCIQAAVVESTYPSSNIRIFYSKRNLNLTSTLKAKTDTNSQLIPAISMSSLLNNFNPERPILIIMDIEGQEMKLLSDSSLLNFSKVSILFELHQHIYSKEQSANVTNNLLNENYKLKFVESAGYYNHSLFNSSGFRRVTRLGKRALYDVEGQDLSLRKLFARDVNFIPFSPFINLRLARSVSLVKGSYVPKVQIPRLKNYLLNIYYFFISKFLSLSNFKSRQDFNF